MNTQRKTATEESHRPGATLLKLSALSTLLALSVLFAASSPGYAGATPEIWQTAQGDVSMTQQAAKDLLLGIRELRAENEALRESLALERRAAEELIAQIEEFRTEIERERRLSQETIARLREELRKEKRKSQTAGIIGAAATILALIL